MLFGGAQALGPALQAIGVSSYYYLFNASPYILTLIVMILTCSNKTAAHRPTRRPRNRSVSRCEAFLVILQSKTLNKAISC